MSKLTVGKLANIAAVFWLATAIASSAQTFTTLFTFNYSDGTGYGMMVQGNNGNFYGTSGGGKYDNGQIFEITPEGKLAVIYAFCPAGPPCIDGQGPNGLMQAANGNFYGTTQAGGTYGDGTVFELTQGGKFTSLHSFCPQNQANCLDGREPVGLVQGFNGNLYGGTATGGVYDRGTIYQITLNGNLTTLYSFCATLGCPDGSGPGRLVLAPTGNFYGVTGDGQCTGCGTFFRMTPAGKLTVLYTFGGPGTSPQGLTLGTDGNFYGTTFYTSCCTLGGIVFRITPQGKESTLHTFCSQTNCADGELPAGWLTQGTDGNFYGITVYGGANSCAEHLFQGCGTIFKITPRGIFTTLYNFCAQTNCSDGEFPAFGAMLATNGIFYGEAAQGADEKGSCGNVGGCGTLYSLSTGIGPFVESNPTFGKAGYTISILGNNLTGTTGVTFNGVPATFNVVSDTFIKATVPAGASAGTITVTTPSNTLNSNVAFQILP